MDLDIFKLEKLKIFAYKDEKREEPPTAEFEAMFNPASLSQTHCIPWAMEKTVNQSALVPRYTGGHSGELSLDLVLDGTGVDEMGVFALARQTVRERVDKFFAVALKFNGKIHETNYLKVTWGGALDLDFDCRLSTVTVKYTAFDRDGSPLRAELAVSLIADEAAKAEQMNSPDLTHARVVRSGDTLPLLTREIYGSSASYLDVARFNGLDDFRNLIPGQELLFPPLASFGSGTSGQG